MSEYTYLRSKRGLILAFILGAQEGNNCGTELQCRKYEHEHILYAIHIHVIKSLRTEKFVKICRCDHHCIPIIRSLLRCFFMVRLMSDELK